MSGLLPVTDRDWSVRAGTSEWDCWRTAEHIGDTLLSYAWQLAVQPSTRYVRAVAVTLIRRAIKSPKLTEQLDALCAELKPPTP